MTNATTPGRRADIELQGTDDRTRRYLDTVGVAQILGFPCAVVDGFHEMGTGPRREYTRDGSSRYQADEVQRYARFITLLRLADSARQDHVPDHTHHDDEM